MNKEMAKLDREVLESFDPNKPSPIDRILVNVYTIPIHDTEDGREIDFENVVIKESCLAKGYVISPFFELRADGKPINFIGYKVLRKIPAQSNMVKDN